MKKQKPSTQNKVGIRRLQPTVAYGRSIGQNIQIAKQLVRLAVAHDAGGTGGVNE